MTLDISIPQGDTKPFRFLIRQRDGSAVDLTGWSLTFTASQETGDDPANFVYSTPVMITDAIGGVVEVPPDGTMEPGCIYYDIKYTDAAAHEGTLLLGRYTVLARFRTT